MNILHVITGLPKAAGTTTFVENVVREQRTLGHTVDICTNQEVDKFLSRNSQLATRNSQLDVVHIHGLWSMLLHKAASYARHRYIPVVWSTHGMTAPWSLHHKWWKKCLPWHLYQKPDLKRAALIHCTTDLEADWNRALGFRNVFIAPLGTNLPCRGGEVENNGRALCPHGAAIDATTKDALNRDCGGQGTARPASVRTLLYVGRIYPVKALDNAIRALALMKQPITLRLVGPDQSGHMAELMSLCDSLHLPYTKPGEDNSSLHLLSPPTFSNSPQVHFIGPKYDADLSAEYDACDALILVSHTENFGATVIDAMAHGRPVITSTKTPWKIVADRGCGWWVDNSPESLAHTFDAFASTSTSNLNLLGQRGLALVRAEYTWPAIASNLISQYEKIGIVAKLGMRSAPTGKRRPPVGEYPPTAQQSPEGAATRGATSPSLVQSGIPQTST